jgi:LacI family transcriptional regulator
LHVIDRTGNTPLYMQFYQLLKEKLHEYMPGDNLPPERLLCQQYGVDRTTVRKALAMLADEKLIDRRQGSGTRVLAEASAAASGSCILFALYQGTRLIDRLGEPFYARSLDAFERRLHKMGKRLVYSTLHPGDKLALLCEKMEAKGVILAGAVDEAIIRQLVALHIPSVTYNSRVSGLPAALADNAQGAQIIAEYLLSLGHRRFGFIHVPGYNNADARLESFRRTLYKHGLAESNLTIAEGDWSERSGHASMKALLNANPAITAVYGGNDSMAAGAIRAAAEAGLRIPEDLSIVGYDDIPQAADAIPPITTVRVDIPAMVEGACMLLFHTYSQEKMTNINAVISPMLIERESAGPCKTTSQGI